MKYGCSLAGLAFSVALIAGGAANAQNLTLAAGPSGGTWYPLGTAVADIIQREIPGTRVSVVNGVTVANILGTNAGQYDLALSLSTSNADALNAIGENFPQPQSNITGVVSFYPSPYQMAVRPGSGIESVADFAGKIVNPGVVGGATDVMTQKLLELNGLSYDDLSRVERLSYADASMQMKDGHIDVFTGIISVPSSAIAEVALGGGINLVPIDQTTVDELRKENDGYSAITIPAGTYPGQDEDTLAVGMNNVLIANAELPADLVEKITKALVENAGQLQQVNAALQNFGPETAGSGIGAPLHPGAEAALAAVGTGGSGGTTQADGEAGASDD
ncbi:TAXI family TRAP transporter solute-binding subunit [Mesorhizobium sp. YIM 152430]|uniref:TAXI family TRAP transporter solute-binding subunit n=1 Tax=Mesorhizobium sp. YIM 152430 TaxID=3031761 RepID=UPI0023DA4FB1|nr:TAXI family TRAP transporter solute-binding subunit [Mesorhizobium sp. YIM 152430]MDF1600914.1 TAXI family TRAP transporter solute-binding subunit [Mesorhizobium sp. YIM 152430]